MSGNIFINYRREDSGGTTGRLYDRLSLSLSRKHLFIDVDDIPAGHDFVSLLDHKVSQCEVLLAVIGARWLEITDRNGRRRLDDPNDFVRIEIASALKRREVHVIPVLVDGAQIPHADQLPDDLKPLVNRNAVEIDNQRFSADTLRLLRAIKAARPWSLTYRPVVTRAAYMALAAAVIGAGLYAVSVGLVKEAAGLEILLRPSAREWSAYSFSDLRNPMVQRSFMRRYEGSPEWDDAFSAAADLSYRAWSKIKDRGNRREISDFLTTYYDSLEADEARALLKDIDARVDTGSTGSAEAPSLKRFRDCAHCPELIVLPPGKFWMGSLESEADRHEHEGPRQQITIPKAFATGRFEVTVGEYKAFVEATGHDAGQECRSESNWAYAPQRNYENPGFEQSDANPVVCVSWNDAVAYVSWLNTVTNGGYRLLTEAEWEYAARGGSPNAFSFGDDISRLCLYGNGADRGTPESDSRNVWCFDGKGRGTARVGSYRPNPFGLRDVYGNVQEWVSDCYHTSYKGMPDEVKSTAASWSGAACGARVIRGGCWRYPPDGMRSAKREEWEASERSYCVGFRVAKTLN